MRAHFDIVGMDPRGVGASTRVRCDPAIWNQVVSWFPRDETSFAQLQEHYRAFGESCLRLTGPLLGHLDTTNVARDLESVRAALGEGKLNFLGLSYGSQLGAAYAELYPENIRVMALDGALDHAQEASSMLAAEAGAYEDAFGRFARWCSGNRTARSKAETSRRSLTILCGARTRTRSRPRAASSSGIAGHRHR